VKWLEDAAVGHGSGTTPQLRAMLCTLHDWVEPNGKHESTIIATAKHIKPLLMPIPTAEQNSRGIFLCMLQIPVPDSIILSTENSRGIFLCMLQIPVPDSNILSAKPTLSNMQHTP